RALTHAHGPDPGHHWKFAGDDPVGVARAAALLIVGDLDVVSARLRESVGETNGRRATIRAEFADDFEVAIQDCDHRLQRAADQHRAVLKRNLLPGGDLNLVIVHIAWARNRLR